MKKHGIVLFVMVMAMMTSVWADAIFIENPSFEEPGTGKPMVGELPGWEAGDTNAWSGAETGWGPTDGLYTGFMQTGAQTYNLTDHVIGGGMEYTLTFDIRKTWVGANPTVALYYDNEGERVSMASIVIELPAGDTTDMEEHTITVKSNDVPESIGKLLGIQITCGTVNNYADGWIGYDNFRLDAVSLTVIPIKPMPDATFVDINEDLAWTVVGDLNVDIYFQVADSNFAGIAPVVMDTSATTYDPGVLEHETTYYWRIDAYEPNENSGFTILTGSVWGFTTAPATPTIILDPVSQTVDAGSTVVLSIDGTNIDSTQWYKDGEVLDGETDLTLTFTDVQVGDEGNYYCDAINGAGTDTSASARVLTKRLIGWWKMDGSVEDSVAEVVPGAPLHSGTPTITEPNYVSLGKDGSAIEFLGDGNVIVADDSVEYFDFYREGYTISVWIKTTQSGWGAFVAKQDRTAWEGIVLTHNGANAVTTMRNSFNDLSSQNATVNDDQWHLVTGSYDSVSGIAKIYVDGSLNNQSAPNFNVVALHGEPLFFGAETTEGEVAYVGLLDDVKIWSYPLDDIAIALLYTDFNPGSEVCLGNPVHDISGPDGMPDCKVDINDFAAFALGWLECNIVPTCIP